LPNMSAGMKQIAVTKSATAQSSAPKFMWHSFL
jgi:hypothetical protein